MLIRTQKETPSVYSTESRDYQLLGHLFDLAFNTSKTSIDAFDPETREVMDDKLIDLACRTIGFFPRHNYDKNALLKLVYSFKGLVKNKGRLKALEDAIKLFLNSQKLKTTFSILEKQDKELEIYLPKQTKNLALLEDIMDYILPIGYLYEFKLRDIRESSGNYVQVLVPKDKIKKPLERTDLQLSKMEYIDELNEAAQTQSDENIEFTPSINIGVVSLSDKEESE